MVKKRELKGIRLLAETGNIQQLDASNFLAHSETDENKSYKVTWQEKRWFCDCADYAKRRRKCKHIYAVGYYLAVKGISLATKSLSNDPKCPKCGRDDLVIKRGIRHNRGGPAQGYYCKRCGIKFAERTAFGGMRNRAAIIATALDLFFRGLSLRQVAEHLWACYRIKITHATINNWIKRYVELVSQYVDNLTANTSGRWHADETLIRVKGRHMYLWALLDHETRLLLASLLSQGRGSEEARALIRKGLAASKNPPEELVTDGNPSYSVAIEHEQKPGGNPIIHIQGPLIKGLNNRMERAIGTIKQRTKTMSRFSSEDGASNFAQGFSVYYNFIKPHRTLKGKVPAQVAGLSSGKSSWLELIEEAAKSGNKTDPSVLVVNKKLRSSQNA
jgi:putative transposase